MSCTHQKRRDWRSLRRRIRKVGGSNGYQTISRSLGGDSASIRYMRPLGSILSSKVTPGGLPGYSFSQRSAMGDDYGPGVLTVH